MRVFWSAAFGVAAIGAVFLGQGAVAAETEAVKSGRALSASLCADCHFIAPDIKTPEGRPPSFQDIANRPQLDPAALRSHLHTTHMGQIIPLGMPNLGLTDDQISRLVAYIMSLRK